MSESKIQAWERKKRNGARKTKEREQRLIMEKLTAEYRAPFPDIKLQVTKTAVTAKTQTIKAGWKSTDNGMQYDSTK